MAIPETLRHKIDLFSTGGKIFRDDNELFSEPSWVAVLIGQGIIPKQYHPFTETLSAKELDELLKGIKNRIATRVASQPSHREYVSGYCAALPVGV